MITEKITRFSMNKLVIFIVTYLFVSLKCQ